MDDATRAAIVQAAKDIIGKIDDMGRAIAKMYPEGGEVDEIRKMFLKAIGDQLEEARNR